MKFKTILEQSSLRIWFIILFVWIVSFAIRLQYLSFVEINSDKGHDSFLLNVPEFLRTVSEFLSSTYNEINNEKRI